jgi:hypothetical protein
VASDNNYCIAMMWWDPGDIVRADGGSTMVPRQVDPTNSLPTSRCKLGGKVVTLHVGFGQHDELTSDEKTR